MEHLMGLHPPWVVPWWHDGHPMGCIMGYPMDGTFRGFPHVNTTEFASHALWHMPWGILDAVGYNLV